MEAKMIMDRLQRDSDLNEAAAKSAFVQWVFDLPDGVTPREEALRVLDDLPREGLTISAAAFRSCLEACLLPVSSPKRRRRLLH